MTVLYGNTLSQTLKEEMKKKIDKLGEEGKRIPMLAVILVGDNPASQSFQGKGVQKHRYAGSHDRDGQKCGNRRCGQGGCQMQ